MNPASMQAGAHKTCVVCGRAFAWRKKWERDWDRVRYCSKRCRSRGTTRRDSELEAAILTLLGERAATSSICPSEAARRLEPESWRDVMEDVRMAARRLTARDVVRITQGGKVVDPSRARGPIRIARGPGFDEHEGSTS